LNIYPKLLESLLVCKLFRKTNFLTDWFTGPLSLSIAKAHTFKHVVSSVVGSCPCVPDSVWITSFMAAICRKKKNSYQFSNEKKTLFFKSL